MAFCEYTTPRIGCFTRAAGKATAKRVAQAGGQAEGNPHEGVEETEKGVLAGRLSSEEIWELVRDLEKGRAILSQVLKSSWWEWSFGSSLFFWRWNGREQQRAARDGMRSFIHKALPVGRKAKRVRMKPDVVVMVANKIEGMTQPRRHTWRRGTSPTWSTIFRSQREIAT